MDKLMAARSAMPVTDVYTNIQGLQQLGKDGNKDEALKKVAQQFESMFINMLLKNMRQANAVFAEDNPFHSEESEFYRDMHDQQLSLTLAHNKGLGIADILYRQLSRDYGSESANVDKGIERNPAPLVPSQKAERVAIADNPKTFVDKVMPYVKKAAETLGVEAEMLTAQAALETGWGKHMLANESGKASNNLFNIKRDSGWQGDSVGVDSLEERDGILQPEKSEFKAYRDMTDSVEDYINLIKGRSHFRNALEAAGDSFEFIRQLHKAGYATDSDYADKIFSVYKQIKQLSGSE